MEVTDKLDAVHDDPVADAVVQTILTAGIGSLVRGGIGLVSGLVDILTSSSEEAGTAAGSVGAELVPKATISLGKWGEARLAQTLGGAGFKPTKAFITSLGPRYVDRLVGNVAYESKAGINVALNSRLETQALKDAELVASGRISGAVWYFWQGAQPETLDFLNALGIRTEVVP